MPDSGFDAPPGWVNTATLDAEETSRVAEVQQAWADFYATGDRTRLVDLGILPAEDAA